jgi:hypothetical protein
LSYRCHLSSDAQNFSFIHDCICALTLRVSC